MPINNSDPGINEGVLAARLFFNQLKKGDPQARARWSRVLLLARQGDPAALRAVRLMQWAKSHPVFVVGARPVLTQERILQLKQLLIQARNTPRKVV